MTLKPQDLIPQSVVSIVKHPNAHFETQTPKEMILQVLPVYELMMSP